MMELLEIPLEGIERDPGQPRKNFDPAALQELAESIKIHGVLQPILVRRGASKKWMVIAGERRFRACEIAGLSTVPAFVADDKVSAVPGASKADAASVLLLQLTENLQRSDIAEAELVDSLLLLIDKSTFGLTQGELAKRLGCSPATISKLLKIRDPGSQAALHVCRPTKLGAVANTLAAFDSLPAGAKRVMKLHSAHTGYLYTENDCSKVKSYLKVDGNELVETDIDEVLATSLEVLKERESAARVGQKRVETAAETEVVIARVQQQPPGLPALGAVTDVDLGQEMMPAKFDAGMKAALVVLPAATALKLVPSASRGADAGASTVEISVAGREITLTNAQVTSLLRRLDADVHSESIADELIKALTRLT